MPENKPDPMDVERVLEALNRALVLQQRSVLQFTMGAGSMFGLEYQAVGAELWRFACAALEDTRRLVEKITALGGDPTVDVGALRWQSDPGAPDHAQAEPGRLAPPRAPEALAGRRLVVAHAHGDRVLVRAGCERALDRVAVGLRRERAARAQSRGHRAAAEQQQDQRPPQQRVVRPGARRGQEADQVREAQPRGTGRAVDRAVGDQPASRAEHDELPEAG